MHRNQCVVQRVSSISFGCRQDYSSMRFSMRPSFSTSRRTIWPFSMP
jgi:hypothetical protein